MLINRINIDADYVAKKCEEVYKKKDLRKYIS
jgi:ATP-dependent protease HslVU (ClpYQ) ATPase subunit